MDQVSVLQRQIAELSAQVKELKAQEGPADQPLKKQRTTVEVFDIAVLFLYSKKQPSGTTSYSWTCRQTDHYRSAKDRVCNCQGNEESDLPTCPNLLLSGKRHRQACEVKQLAGKTYVDLQKLGNVTLIQL